MQDGGYNMTNTETIIHFYGHL